MNRRCKQILFVILSILLIGVSEHFTSNRVQASRTYKSQLILLQATQLSPIPQSTTFPTSQAITPSNVQLQQVVEWIKKYSSQTLGIVIIVTASVGYLGIFLFRPSLLLTLIPVTEIKIPTTEIKLPLGILIWLKYQPRVLDAWVSERIQLAKDTFRDRPTVKDRRVHIPIQVELNGDKPAIANFSANDLKVVFSKRSTRLLIVGEGGVGKTSLACQIAKWAMAKNKAERLCKHRMLPVLIEEELESIDGKSPLLEAIAYQIKNLRDDEKPVSDELLKQLLEKRRILVIVDHFSEMSSQTKKTVGLRDPSSPVNALIITSRTENIGKEVSYTTIKPQRVSGNQLSIFMDAYLTQRGKRDLFDDVEYFDALGRLSQIVTNERDVTVLFAKLYADQMVAIAEGLVTEDLPNNVPDLMLNYINEVNREKDGKIDDDIIQRDLKVIAWECLKQTFKPETIEREHAISCLAALEDGNKAAQESARKRLKYLEERLVLIRTIPPAKTKIRFALDPLSEYLAALHLVELYGEDEKIWQSFLDEAKNKPSTLEEIRGFLLAVRDCCIAKTKEAKIPEFVIKELGKLASLDLESLEREQLNRRVRNLITDLSRPDPEDRLHALWAIQGIGAGAKAVVPTLVKTLQDPDNEVRENAAEALGEIGIVRKDVVESLIEAFNEGLIPSHAAFGALRKLGKAAKSATPFLISMLDKDVKNWGTRWHAAAAIGRIDPELAVTIPAFHKVVYEIIEKLILDVENPEFYLGQHAKMLGEIGPAASIAVPHIITILEKNIDNKEFNRYTASQFIQTLGEMGTVAEKAVPYLIKALKQKSTIVGMNAATALGNIRTKSPDAIMALEDICIHGDYFARGAAKKAIEKILSEEE